MQIGSLPSGFDVCQRCAGNSDRFREICLLHATQFSRIGNTLTKQLVYLITLHRGQMPRKLSFVKRASVTYNKQSKVCQTNVHFAN